MLLRCTVLILLILSHLCVSLSSSYPNIWYILVDDLGWANVQFHNNRMITPNIDNLLSESIHMNHYYTYMFCSPTRSSFLSGRLPYHVNEENSNQCVPGAGIPVNMTTISERLVSDAGYTAHQIGKWHVGLSSNLVIPSGRLFNTSLGFLHGGEDHFTQILNQTQLNGPTCIGVDLWETDKPAYDQNGTYGGYIYWNRALEIVENHNPDEPVFVYMALQDNHAPYEVPQQYIDKFPSDWYYLQRDVAGMSNFWDEMLFNLTTLLKSSGMWNNTLLIITSDNGGPSGTDLHAANNSPLRGGKYSNFEGGVRVISLISGGLIPENRRGISLNGTMHIADWYSTFCYLAGNIDPTDERALKYNLPPIDSMNMWPFLMGQNGLDISPRKEIFLSSGSNGGIIMENNISKYKLIFGQQRPAFWTTLDYPNGTAGQPDSINCGSIEIGGCFFDIMNDPTEHNDLINKSEYKQLIEEMRQKFLQQRNSTYNPDRGQPDPKCCAQIALNNGYWGPWNNLTRD